MSTVKRNAQGNLLRRVIILSRNRKAISVKAQCAPAAAIILLQWLRTADVPVISVSVRYSSVVGKHIFLNTTFERFPDALYILCLSTRQKHFNLLWYRPPPVVKWDLSPIRPVLDGDICYSAIPTQSIGQTCHYISLVVTVSMIKDGWNKLLLGNLPFFEIHR